MLEQVHVPKLTILVTLDSWMKEAETNPPTIQRYSTNRKDLMITQVDTILISNRFRKNFRVPRFKPRTSVDEAQMLPLDFTYRKLIVLDKKSSSSQILNRGEKDRNLAALNTVLSIPPCSRAVVVAQLVERSLMTPEIRGPNPNIGKVLSSNCN